MNTEKSVLEIVEAWKAKMKAAGRYVDDMIELRARADKVHTLPCRSAAPANFAAMCYSRFTLVSHNQVIVSPRPERFTRFNERGERGACET
jgi:hypothetical protein